MFASYVGVTIPTAVGQASVFLPIAALYTLLKGTQSERTTIMVWSTIASFGFGGLAHFVLGGYMEATASIALATACAVSMVIFGLATLATLLAQLWNYSSGGSKGQTPEERVLSQSEYDDFGSNPYEDKFSSAVGAASN